jgi:hypothetical protein
VGNINNGMPPFLATRNGVRTYQCPEDCRQTIAIFAQELTDYTINNIRWNARFSRYSYGQDVYRKVAVQSRDATTNSRATVTFNGNPGTTTQVYYHLYSLLPTEVRSELIEIQIPDGDGNHMEILEGVVYFARFFKYGNSNEWKEWKKTGLLRIKRNLSKGEQGLVQGTVSQPEYRTYHGRSYYRR